MKSFLRALVFLGILLPVLAKAQSGIGLPPFDATTAFHVKNTPFANPIRLDGLQDDPTNTLTDVIVKDANGILYYRPISDLTVSGEWIDHATQPYIFANQANGAGNDVVVSDDGRFGIGIVAPRNAIDIRDGGIVIERPGTNASGTPDINEGIRLTGTTSDALITTNDGSGNFNTKYNASYGVGNFLVSGRQAFQTRIDAVNSTSSVAYYLRQSTSNGNAGDPIGWRDDFQMLGDGRIRMRNNVAIGGIFNPTATLDVNGTARIRNLPDGLVNDDPLNTDDLVTADVNGNLRSIRPDIFFRDAGEWSNHSSSNYIFARRAEEETGNDVVVSRDGELGLGLTSPTSLLHLRGGGMRIDGLDQGIGFNSENPYPADPIRDGFRMYHENGSFGGWRDAFIFEKTDVNNLTVDGGIAFANRQAGDNRVISMVIRGDGEVGIGDNHVNPTERLHVLGRGLFQQGGTGTSADQGMIMLVDDRDNERPSWANRGLQVADNNEYAYFGMEDRNIGHDALLMWGDGLNQDLHFMHDNGGTQREVMMLDGQRLNVGIGTIPVADANVKLHVGGRTRIDDLDPQGAFDEANDLIVIADANGNLQTVTSAVFKQDFEDLDWVINGNEIYNANTGAVGIGLTNPNDASALHISGDLRMENSSAIELDDNDVRIFAPNDGQLDIEAQTLTTFQHINTTGVDPLVIDHQNGRVSIGIGRAGNALSATVDGVLNMQDDSEIQFGSNSNNIIYAQSANDLRQTANQLWSVRNRGDATGILSVRTDQQRVGINRNNPEDALDVDGRMRLRDVPVENGYDQFLVVNPADGTVRRRDLDNFEGPWERNVSGAEGRTVLRDVNDVVGIGTAAPSTNVSLHIVEQNGTVAQRDRGTIMLDHEDAGGSSSIVFRSRVNRGSDYGYINYYDDNPNLTTGSAEQSLLEIGVQNDGANSNRDDIALMPSGELGIKTRVPTRDMDINGDLRIRTIPTSNTDNFALTTDANGNVNRQAITSIKDNLGNHIATEDIQVADNTISYDKDPNGGIKFHSSNSVMVSGRFQIGNHREYWMDEAITGITAEGFATNDAAIFVPVHTGTENSDLRLYITDNANDAFSIWGSPCPTDCGDINASTQVVRIEGGGEVTMNSLAGTGTRMVVADANGVLNTQAIPTAGGGSTADNLGNHIATQELNLNWNWVRHNSGSNRAFRVRDDGTLEMAANRAIRFQVWNNRLAQTATGMELRSQNDLELQAINNDFIMQAGDRIDIRSNGTAADDEIRLMTSGGNERIVVQNDGEIEISDLTGTGNALVGVDANGVLERVSTSSDGLWDRDAANQETFLFNTNDDVGIGTSNPDAALHVFRNSNSVEAEVRIQNNNGNGDSRLRFMDGGNPINDGMSFRLDGSDNDLYLEHNNGRQYMTFEQGNGNVGVGAQDPQVMLHVMRRAGSTATGGSDAQSGYNNPARLRISNEAGNGSSALEFSEGGAGLGNNTGMSLRYQGDLNEFHIVRGPSEDQNLNDIHLRIARNSGQTTIRHLGTTVTPGGTEMVVADDNGVLSTRAFDDNIWGKDDTDSEVWLDPAISGYQVGIGTANPQRKLHVAGDVRIENLGTGAATDEIVTVDANGDLRTLPASDFENYWQRDGSGNLYPATSADNVGIGESSPAAKLHVDGDAIVTTMSAGIVGTDEIVVVDGSGLLKKVPANSFDSFWERNTAGSQDYIELSTTTDFVGLGVIGAPTAQLHTSGTVRFESLANVSGNEVVVADASGQLSTVALPTQLWDRDIANGYTFTSFSSDNVGIGTSTPSSKLHIGSGQVTITDINSVTGDEDTDRVVVASGTGELRSLPVGTLESHWTYESATNELYPKDLSAAVGIGTNDPRSDVHLYGESATTSVGDPVEFQIQNRRNGGTAAIRFRDNAWTGANADNYNSVSLRWVGQYNHFEIANGSDSTLFRIRRQNGNTAIGYNLPPGFHPPEQLWVQGDIGLEDGGDIQFAEANSYLRDNGTDTNVGNDGDVILSAADDLRLRSDVNLTIDANNNWTAQVDGNIDFEVDGSAIIDADAGARLNARGGSLDLRGNTRTDFFTGASDLQARISSAGRFEVFDNADAWDLVNRGTTYLEETVRIIDLNGSGTQMVVADNNGTLSKQPILVDTDDQGLLFSANTITIEDGTGSIDLTPYLDNTDDQGLLFSSNTITIEDGTGSIDLSPYLDNTDAQAISLTGTTLEITGNASTVDLSSIGTLSGWSKTGSDITLATASDNVGIGITPAAGVRLHVGSGNVRFDALSGGVTEMIVADVNGQLSKQAIPVDTDTDDQGLLFSSNTITIEDGTGSIDLSPYLDDTDDQGLLFSSNTITIEDGTGSIDLSPYLDDTDDQGLLFSSNTITIEDGSGSIDLSPYLDNTDAQAISLSGTTLEITGNASTVDLSSIGSLSGWSRTAGDITLATATDNVGIGVSPDASVRFQVGSGNVRFDVLSGGGNEMVVADVNGQLSKQAIPTFTNYLARSGTQTELANTGDNLMIGVGTATAKLHVAGDANIEGLLTITSTGTNDPLRLENLQAYTGGSPYDILVVDADGDVQVHNSATASDRRLKENIKPMEGTLEKLLGLESVSFNYRQDVEDYPYSLDDETHYGVIAQQVKEAFPHAVVEKDGYLHIQEKELMGVVISATKELNAKNAELEAANEHLAEQVYHMMMDKADLEKTVHGLRAETSELQKSMAKVLEHLERGKQVQASGN